MKLYYKTHDNIVNLSSFMVERGVQEGPMTFLMELFEAFKKKPEKIPQKALEDRDVEVIEKGLIPFVIQQFEAYAKELEELPQNPFKIKNIEEYDLDIAIANVERTVELALSKTDVESVPSAFEVAGATLMEALRHVGRMLAMREYDEYNRNDHQLGDELKHVSEMLEPLKRECVGEDQTIATIEKFIKGVVAYLDEINLYLFADHNSMLEPYEVLKKYPCKVKIARVEFNASVRKYLDKCYEDYSVLSTFIFSALEEFQPVFNALCFTVESPIKRRRTSTQSVEEFKILKEIEEVNLLYLRLKKALQEGKTSIIALLVNIMRLKFLTEETRKLITKHKSTLEMVEVEEFLRHLPENPLLSRYYSEDLFPEPITIPMDFWLLRTVKLISIDDVSVLSRCLHQYRNSLDTTGEILRGNHNPFCSVRGERSPLSILGKIDEAIFGVPSIDD